MSRLSEPPLTSKMIITLMFIIKLFLSTTCSEQINAECQPGHFGARCEPCPESCEGGICSSKGLCHDCVDGYYGIRCNRPCPPTCPYKACFRYNVSCKHSCQTGQYGLQCNFNCTNCPEGCDRKTGICLSEFVLRKAFATSSRCGVDPQNWTQCLSGCHGNRCDIPCPDDYVECERYTARCLDCIIGKYGQCCENTCPNECQKNGCDGNGKCTLDNGLDGSKMIIIVVAIVTAVVAIIIVVIVSAVIVIRMRCSLKRQGKAHEDESPKRGVETVCTSAERYIEMKKDKTQFDDSGQTMYRPTTDTSVITESHTNAFKT